MHAHDVNQWSPPHVFDEGNPAGERGTRKVLAITVVAMVVEIVAGWWFNSMALLADGWHMGSHAVAIGLSVFAYAAARRYAKDTRFAFGTWKIEVLGGFTGALLLLGVAALMVVGSVERLVQPLAIRFDEAIIVAVLGLAVNLVCARLLHGSHGHSHGHDHHHYSHHAHAESDRHGHEHEHEHHHHHAPSAHAHAASGGQDLNLRSAYVHVLADAATSVFAILALVGGKYFGWVWLDPAIALVGAALVAVWAVRLLKQTTSVLVDREMGEPMIERVSHLLNTQPDIDIADLHIWRVGRSKYACIVSVVTHRRDLTPAAVKALLQQLPELYHVTVEVNLCSDSGNAVAGVCH